LLGLAHLYKWLEQPFINIDILKVYFSSEAWGSFIIIKGSAFIKNARAPSPSPKLRLGLEAPK
jgi:hypothetical protein